LLVWRNENCIQNFGLGNLKGRDNLEDLGVNGLIILKWILIFSLHPGHRFNVTSSLYVVEKERVLGEGAVLASTDLPPVDCSHRKARTTYNCSNTIRVSYVD
jgi:hypothetical protein